MPVSFRSYPHTCITSTVHHFLSPSLSFYLHSPPFHRSIFSHYLIFAILFFRSLAVLRFLASCMFSTPKLESHIRKPFPQPQFSGSSALRNLLVYVFIRPNFLILRNPFISRERVFRSDLCGVSDAS